MLFPDYTVCAEHLDEWSAKFQRLSEQLLELTDEIAAVEAAHTDGPAGPWCSYLIRARLALTQRPQDFEEHTRDAHQARVPIASETH